MKTCVATLKSASSYSQSRPYVTERFEKESHDAFEKRTWREKCHADADGTLFIPGMAFKMALDRAAAFLSIKIPGRKNSLYTKHFLAGVLVTENASLGLRKEEVVGEPLFMNADGKRGSGTRVWRWFPVIPDWRAAVTFHVADDTITKEVFETVLAESGKFIGVGRFRPEKGGFYGRYGVEKLAWK